jgi:hypothetical protein
MYSQELLTRVDNPRTTWWRFGGASRSGQNSGHGRREVLSAPAETGYW